MPALFTFYIPSRPAYLHCCVLHPCRHPLFKQKPSCSHQHVCYISCGGMPPKKLSSEVPRPGVQTRWPGVYKLLTEAYVSADSLYNLWQLGLQSPPKRSPLCYTSACHWHGWQQGVTNKSFVDADGGRNSRASGSRNRRRPPRQLPSGVAKDADVLEVWFETKQQERERRR